MSNELNDKNIEVIPKSTNHVRKYDPAKHIPLLDVIFSTGEGIHAFCAEADIHRETFLMWRKKYPDFLEAYKKAMSKAARRWERMPIEAAEAGIKFNYQHWYMVMRMRGYLRHDVLEECEGEDTTEGKLSVMWQAFKTGSISSDDFAKVVTAISGGLRAKELEISSRELDIKAKELEYQRENRGEMSKVSDEALEAFMLVKSGKGKVIKDE